MALIIAKFRKKKSTYEVLEKLENEIVSIEEFGRGTELYRKKVIGRFILLAVLTYLILSCLIYYYYNRISSNNKLIYIIPLVAFSFIVVIIKKFLAWYYAIKLQRNEKKLVKLREDKKKIIDNVMETETYKVAKKILDKFGNETKKPVLEVSTTTDLVARTSQAGLRQRNIGANQTLKTRLFAGSTAMFQNRPLPQQAPLLGPSRSNTLVPTPGLRMAAPRAGPLATGTPLPSPMGVLPANRSVLDKMVDYLVGDGPSNRYALICKKCFCHNGMAVKEEFEYISFRCYYCAHFNPARKMKPTGPRFGSTSKIESVDNSSDSDRDSPDSDPETTLQPIESVKSRRSSSETEVPVPIQTVAAVELPKESASERNSNSSPELEKYSDFDKLSDLESRESEPTDKSPEDSGIPQESVESTNATPEKAVFEETPMEIDRDKSATEF
ncbi:endoplasmic reticulum junction formation protein lunapark-B-like [Diabrotica virgifera virgifera]|uniref:Endoplasmic reticulum junction formation protein lunapark n=1 Tax=Diabrotica virgifera virgifera TaxID=50390 RepID=A0ABM5JIE6_DIAVI|nr:endoplasmic reticulum junction formation protein lunapark-B-like [Diabrotica virgifera virgifera]